MNEFKRRWFRFHLTTLIAISLTAAAFLWANVHEHAEVNVEWRGFPFPMYQTTQLRLPFDAGDGGTSVRMWSHHAYATIGPFRFAYQDNGWSVGLTALNVLIGMIAVSGVAALSELLIRRRSRQKGIS